VRSLVHAEAIAVDLVQAVKPVPLLRQDGRTASPRSIHMQPHTMPAAAAAA
jgi:hypothetical protein